MATAPATINIQCRPPSKTERAARPRHVTQKLAARVVGVSESTLGRWVVELGDSGLPEWGGHWTLTAVVHASLFAAISRCPANEKDRPAVIAMYEILRDALIQDFAEGLRHVLYWSKSGGLEIADDRTLVEDQFSGNSQASAVIWVCDVGITIGSTIAAYRRMLKAEGLTDRAAEFEAAIATADYWTRTENVAILNENGLEKSGRLLND